MNHIRRSVTGLVAAFLALFLTSVGGTAFASQQPPDPASDGFPPVAPLPIAPGASTGTSVAQELGWMLSGAAAVLLVAVVVACTAILARRHRASVRLRTP